VIHFSQVYKRYPNGFDALKHVSLFIPRGSITFLIGHSGAGKSTLLKLISLLDTANKGQVLVNEVNLARLKGDRIAKYRRSVGFIFQDNLLLHDRSVQDNVALPLIVSGIEHRECKRRVCAALDKVGLIDKAKRYPISLSSGEQQRVGIARAVVGRPDILLADEPTGNLTPELADEIMKLFFMFHQLNVTVLIATHDHRHLADKSTGLLALDQGQIMHDSYS